MPYHSRIIGLDYGPVEGIKKEGGMLMDELAAVTVVSDLMRDIETLRAERDALALELSGLSNKLWLHTLNSLSERVFSESPRSKLPTIFSLARTLSFLNTAWHVASTSDLPEGNGQASPLWIIQRAMNSVLKDYVILV